MFIVKNEIGRSVHTKIKCAFKMSYLFLALALVSPGAVKATNVESVLEQSIYNSDKAPTDFDDFKLLQYDPLVLSVTATVRSRASKIKPIEVKTKRGRRFVKVWEDILLSPQSKQSICSGDLKAYFKASSTKSPYTFVILPGSYTTHKSGAFINQTSDVLIQNFNDPNILAFSGYLSSDFIGDACKKIPWDSVAIANDLHQRIEAFFERHNLNKESSGIVGFSGGGFLTSIILSADGAPNRQPIFGLGGLSFSPILIPVVAFDILDSEYKSSSIRQDKAISSLNFNNIRSFLKYGTPPETDFSRMQLEDPTEFRNRFYNEFTHVSLRQTIDAVGISIDTSDNELSYENFYIYNGFKTDNPKIETSFLKEKFIQDTDITHELEHIKAPHLIYFSQDDPILAAKIGEPQDSRIDELLETASQNPNITVFNPKYGAHVGALVDPIFEELVTEFFNQSEELID